MVSFRKVLILCFGWLFVILPITVFYVFYALFSSSPYEYIITGAMIILWISSVVLTIWLLFFVTEKTTQLGADNTSTYTYPSRMLQVFYFFATLFFNFYVWFKIFSFSVGTYFPEQAGIFGIPIMLSLCVPGFISTFLFCFFYLKKHTLIMSSVKRSMIHTFLTVFSIIFVIDISLILFSFALQKPRDVRVSFNLTTDGSVPTAIFSFDRPMITFGPVVPSITYINQDIKNEENQSRIWPEEENCYRLTFSNTMCIFKSISDKMYFHHNEKGARYIITGNFIPEPINVEIPKFFPMEDRMGDSFFMSLKKIGSQDFVISWSVIESFNSVFDTTSSTFKNVQTTISCFAEDGTPSWRGSKELKGQQVLTDINTITTFSLRCESEYLGETYENTLRVTAQP